jgi:D-apionate oxidoisomerase
MASKVALVGAGGKMGTRILKNLEKTNHDLILVESKPDAREALSKTGHNLQDLGDAAGAADFVILAVPDAVLGKLSHDVTPKMKPGGTLILLDPAAAYAGQVKIRDDCTFVVTHPCHPSLFTPQDSDEARADRFGGVVARQDVVIALMRGEEQAFEQAKQLVLEMFAPVMSAFRITVEQMALLEPAMAEVVGATLGTVMKEAMEEAIKRGVPADAARSFMLGHITIELAILFESSNPFSDAAVKAIDYGYERIVQKDWRKVFEPEAIQEVLQKMLSA